MDESNQQSAELRADESEMSNRIEFFYDYVSLYSYLANSQADKLGAGVQYRPMLLGAVMEATGNRPPGLVEAKRNYMLKDVKRWTERYSLPWKMNPVFPQNTLKALRLALVARKEGKFEGVHRALFAAMWEQEKVLDDEAVLKAIADAAGVNFGRIDDAAIKEELKANTEEAVARGAFGAPTFFVGDEMFFGNDRLDFVRDALGVRAGL